MSAEKLEQSFGRMGTAMKLALGAGVVAGAGYAAIKVADDLARHGEKLLHQQNVMLRNGQSFAEVTNLTADAYDRITRLVPTATGSDVLRTISELRSVLGDTTEAVSQTPFALKLDAILGNLTGKDFGRFRLCAMACSRNEGHDRMGPARRVEAWRDDGADHRRIERQG